MMTAENIRALIPQMKEWGQHTAAQLCHEAAVEIEALQKEIERNRKSVELADQVRLLAFLTDEKVLELRRQNAELREACTEAWNAFDNGKRKHHSDGLTGKCIVGCQACAIEKLKKYLAAQPEKEAK